MNPPLSSFSPSCSKYIGKIFDNWQEFPPKLCSVKPRVKSTPDQCGRTGNFQVLPGLSELHSNLLQSASRSPILA